MTSRYESTCMLLVCWCMLARRVTLVWVGWFGCLFFLMIRRPPRSTRTDTLFPYTTLFRSQSDSLPLTAANLCNRAPCRDADSGMNWRSEEHTSELQSLMRISYAVFCLKKKKTTKKNNDI